MSLSSTQAFSTHATFSVGASCRIVKEACCPMMDLVALVSRTSGGSDRLALWRMQGGKVWDALSSENDETNDSRIMHLAWSPDGLTILCSHHPPRLSLHSVHDGSLVRTLAIPSGVGAIAAVWWLDHDGQPPTDELADLMRRGSNTPGSAHSLLARLPLLDSYKDPVPSKPMMGIGAVAGFGLPEPPKQKWYEPSPTIRSIPALPLNLESASINASNRPATTSRTRNASRGKPKDESVEPDIGTLVVAADTQGALHCYLDGSFPLGSITVADSGHAVSLVKRGSIISLAVQVADDRPALVPALVDIPLAAEPATRNVARASSTIRALLDYIHLGIEELVLVWIGRQGNDGVKDTGNYWANLMQDKKRSFNDRIVPGPIAELTLLLLTGRATDSLQDFLGSGGRLTDRSVNHWEQTVSHALIKMRDYAGQRLAPAAERLVIVLEEIRGWAAWPEQYEPFRFLPCMIEECLRRAHRLIAYSQWLAIEANAEHARFLEFIKFIRSEIHKASDPDPNARALGSAQNQFDLLEAVDYLEHGFVDSPLTAWFTGPMPRSYPGEIWSKQTSLSGSIAEARQFLESSTDLEAPPGLEEQEAIARSNRSLLAEYPERNLVALVGDLAQQCAELCGEAAGATTRHARVVRDNTGSPGDNIDAGKSKVHHEDSCLAGPRERTITNREGKGSREQYVAIRAQRADNTYLCLLRIVHGHEATQLRPQEVGAAVMKCAARAREDSEETLDLEILDLDFFDDDALVLVVRTQDRAFITTVMYQSLEYAGVAAEDDHCTWEALAELATGEHGAGTYFGVGLPIERSRELGAWSGGGAQLAVNGRRGRRMACVLDETGALEVLDMEGDEDADGDTDAESGPENDG